MVTYDPQGGYGHPDHVHAHTVTTAAVAAAGPGTGPVAGDYPGEPWTVPKFYWTVLARSAFKAAFDTLRGDDLLPEWTMPPPVDDIPFGFSDEDIDAVVEGGPDARAAKVGGARRPRHPSHRRPDGPGVRRVEQHGDADRRTRALCPRRRFPGRTR